MVLEVIEQADLFFKEGTSDKVYHVKLVRDPSTDLFTVQYAYGRRGNTLTEGDKGTSLPEAKAFKLFHSIVDEKTAKGYQYMSSATKVVTNKATGKCSVVPMLLNDVTSDAELQALLSSSNWVMQHKHDGKRILVEVNGPVIQAFNKSGKPTDLPDAVLKELRALKVTGLMLDGELVGDSFITFDLLRVQGEDLTNWPLSARVQAMDAMYTIGRTTTYVGEKIKREEFAAAQKAGREGVVFKALDAPYKAGRTASALKYKFVATATVQVLKQNAKRSVAMGMYAGTVMVPVGDVSIPVNKEIPPVGAFIEVRYLYAYPATNNLYQPVYLGERDDVDLDDTHIKQLKYKVPEAPKPPVSIEATAIEATADAIEKLGAVDIKTTTPGKVVTPVEKEVYLVVAQNYDYNDEYYTAEEGETTVAVFDTKELAEQEALRRTATAIKSYASTAFGDWNESAWDEWPSNLDVKFAQILGVAIEDLGDFRDFRLPSGLSNNRLLQLARIWPIPHYSFKTMKVQSE